MEEELSQKQMEETQAKGGVEDSSLKLNPMIIAIANQGGINGALNFRNDEISLRDTSNVADSDSTIMEQINNQVKLFQNRPTKINTLVVSNAYSAAL